MMIQKRTFFFGFSYGEKGFFFFNQSKKKNENRKKNMNPVSVLSSLLGFFTCLLSMVHNTTITEKEMTVSTRTTLFLPPEVCIVLLFVSASWTGYLAHEQGKRVGFILFVLFCMLRTMMITQRTV